MRTGFCCSLFTLRGLDRKVLRTYDSSQGVNAFTDAIWANGRLFATATSAGAVAHWHTDELGTPIVQTNAAGGVQASYAYFPYGEEINQSVVDPTRFRFTAHERDLGTQPGTADDRDYMHQRSTLPQLGRFLTVEPIGGNPFNPQSWNRFTYALNNPLKYTDPLGLLTHSETITVFPTQPEVGPTNGPNTFDPPKTGPGDETAGGDGSSSASSSKTETPDSETPPCDAVDRFYAGAESLVRKVLPLEVSINISRPPFALNLNLNFSESRRASLYVGGGLGAGRGGVAMSGRFAGVSRGPGSQGVTGRFSFSSPPFLLGVLGLGTSVSVSEGGMDPRFTAGLGPSGGPSFTVTGGYTLVSDPIGKSVGPCE